MAYELKVADGHDGQLIRRPRQVEIPDDGEWHEVDEQTYEQHKDRAVFEARSDEDGYECEECGKSFDTERGRNQHARQAHED